mmetsp:Transcript_7615/g.30146  ORF Transcript_7615/g.30146 Transcript_7615/m.30146 type:complete len:226 (+) Transcript_7615:432-1109(+)
MAPTRPPSRTGASTWGPEREPTPAKAPRRRDGAPVPLPRRRCAAAPPCSGDAAPRWTARRQTSRWGTGTAPRPRPQQARPAPPQSQPDPGTRRTLRAAHPAAQPRCTCRSRTPRPRPGSRSRAPRGRTTRAATASGGSPRSGAQLHRRRHGRSAARCQAFRRHPPAQPPRRPAHPSAWPPQAKPALARSRTRRGQRQPQPQQRQAQTGAEPSRKRRALPGLQSAA